MGYKQIILFLLLPLCSVAQNISSYSFCQDGEPVGGGEGYSRIVTSSDATITISSFSTITAFKNTIEAATSGAVIWIDPSLTIDLTNIYSETGDVTIELAAGVTLASNRGENGSKGALIKDLRFTDADDLTTYPLRQQAPIFFANGDGVRITGLRIEGPHQNNGPYPGKKTSYGVGCTYNDNFEVDNCEIYNFGFAAVATGWPPMANYDAKYSSSYTVRTGHKIHHNYLHNNAIENYGYGAMVAYAIDVEVYGNLFYYNRHDIATRGLSTNGYDFYCNTILPSGTYHNIDAHGTNEVNPTGGETGLIKIHHNDIRDTGYFVSNGGIRDNAGTPTTELNIFIRGQAQDGSYIRYNRFYKPGTISNVLGINFQGTGNDGNIPASFNTFGGAVPSGEEQPSATSKYFLKSFYDN